MTTRFYRGFPSPGGELVGLDLNNLSLAYIWRIEHRNRPAKCRSKANERGDRYVEEIIKVKKGNFYVVY
ncbi:hypothetical protein SPLC1_S411580 [Arthrospira platensis C1]|nr:hypothetical protein SPLC1_S411580 [Arthrospira platensis C1]